MQGLLYFTVLWSDSSWSLESEAVPEGPLSGPIVAAAVERVRQRLTQEQRPYQVEHVGVHPFSIRSLNQRRQSSTNESWFSFVVPDTAVLLEARVRAPDASEAVRRLQGALHGYLPPDASSVIVPVPDQSDSSYIHSLRCRISPVQIGVGHIVAMEDEGVADEE